MAVPKRKVSKSRKRKRRSHHALTATGVVKCSRCGSPRLPHAICDTCGYYRGKPVLPADEEI